MRKSFSASVLIAVVILLVATTTAYAAMPKGTLVMKDKAYSLNYAALSENTSEILQAFQAAGYSLYYKNYAGTWENAMGSAVQTSVIPAVTYKDVGKDPVQYAAGDGDIITGAMATVNYEFSRPGFVYVVTITVTDDDQAAKYCLFDQDGSQISDIVDLGVQAALAPGVSSGDILSVKIMDSNEQVLATNNVTVTDGTGSYQYAVQGNGGDDGDDFEVIDIY